MISVHFRHPSAGAPPSATFGPFEAVDVETGQVLGRNGVDATFVAEAIGGNPRNTVWKTRKGLYHDFTVAAAAATPDAI